MSFINGYISVCLFFSVLYSIGFLIFLSDFKEDECEMTYMFEYPQFVKISNKKDEQFPKYGLYAYSEGRFTTKVRSMYFNGIPVLFIPGNGGSYKQVRSLSSVALRKALSSKSSYHFDYFTVNLNSELSGFYGPLLYDQLDYVNGSINRIFELYKEKNRPKSVILIGHSMGGVIAKKLISERGINSVALLITLAAPLKRPPLICDYHIDHFYNSFEGIESIDTMTISISGGYSDFLVQPYLSDIRENNSLHVVTTNIPRSWIEANHVQIVWCKQTVLAITRALFDSIDIQTKQVSSNWTYISNVFKHHLVQNSGIRVQNLNSYSDIIKIDHRGQWIESLLRQYSIEFLHGLKETHWYMMKFNILPSHEMLTILGINIESVNWVFACNANLPKGASRVCTEAIHITHLSEIAPSIKYKRRYLQINMHELRKNNSELTHVVVRLLPTSEPVNFHVDMYDSKERKINVNLPYWWTFKKSIILDESFKNAVHYELLLPQLQHILQFYQLFIEPLKCVAPDNHHASASLVVPWGNQNHHAYITDTRKDVLNVRLYTSKPSSESNNSVSIRLTLDPSCTYKISIKPSLFGILGQMARTYTPLLITNIAVIVLLSLKYQLKSLRDGSCPIFFIAIKEGAKPYYVLPFIKISLFLLSKLRLYVDLPIDDNFYLSENGTEFFALPILLLLCSVGIVFVLCIVYSISLLTMDSTVHKLCLKLTRTVFFSISYSDYITTVLQKAPFIAAAALVLISISTCGSLALCLGAIFYFLKLTHMSQDYVEKIVWFFVKQFAQKFKNIIGRKTGNDTKNQLENTQILKREENISSDSPSKQTSDTNDINKDTLGEHSEQSLLQKSNSETSLLKNITKEETNTDEPENLAENIDVEQKEEDNKEKTKVHDTTDENEISEQNVNSIMEVDEIKITDKDEVKTDHGDDELAEANNSIFFHSSLFFIWCIITVINLPATLTWAHNFKYSKTLTPDSSFIPGFVLSICAFPLWQFDFPKPHRKWSTKLEVFIHIISVVSLIFAVVSVYRLSYLLTIVIVLITLHQLFAPRDTTDSDNQIENVENKLNYENVKLKLN